MNKGDIVVQESGGDKAYRGVIVAMNKHGECLVRWHKGYSTWEASASLKIEVTA